MDEGMRWATGYLRLLTSTDLNATDREARLCEFRDNFADVCGFDAQEVEEAFLRVAAMIRVVNARRQ